MGTARRAQWGETTHVVPIASMTEPLPHRAQKRIGRRSPPCEGLIGRSEACRILGCEGRQFRRWVDKGLIRPALVQRDSSGHLEARWFDRDDIQVIARTIRRLRRAAGRAKTTPCKRRESLAPTPRPQCREPAGCPPHPRQYHPERRLRDFVPVAPPTPTDRRPSPTRVVAPASSRTYIPREWLTSLARPPLLPAYPLDSAREDASSQGDRCPPCGGLAGQSGRGSEGDRE